MEPEGMYVAAFEQAIIALQEVEFRFLRLILYIFSITLQSVT